MVQSLNVACAPRPDRLQVLRISVLAAELAAAAPNHENTLVFHGANPDRIRTDLVVMRLTHRHTTAYPLLALAVDGLHVACESWVRANALEQSEHAKGFFLAGLIEDSMSCTPSLVSSPSAPTMAPSKWPPAPYGTKL